MNTNGQRRLKHVEIYCRSNGDWRGIAVVTLSNSEERLFRVHLKAQGADTPEQALELAHKLFEASYHYYEECGVSSTGPVIDVSLTDPTLYRDCEIEDAYDNLDKQRFFI